MWPYLLGSALACEEYSWYSTFSLFVDWSILLNFSSQNPHNLSDLSSLFEVIRMKMEVDEDLVHQQIRHSTTHPKYLHSNSTSHKWVFGAIAELVDNSVDAKASQFFVDVEDNPINFNDKLFTIRDNGSGYVVLSHMLTNEAQRSFSHSPCSLFHHTI
jgi:hypothetical protein